MRTPAQPSARKLDHEQFQHPPEQAQALLQIFASSRQPPGLLQQADRQVPKQATPANDAMAAHNYQDHYQPHLP